MMRRGPRAAVYQTQLESGQITRDGTAASVSPIASAEMRKGIQAEAAKIGIGSEEIARRIETGAGNAWQEREWIKADLLAVAEAKRLDLIREKDRGLAAELVDGFYSQAAKIVDRALEHTHHHTNDRLTRTLQSMAQGVAQGQDLQFGHEEQAERFTHDLRERYGSDVIRRIAKGDDRALAVDFPMPRSARKLLCPSFPPRKVIRASACPCARSSRASSGCSSVRVQCRIASTSAMMAGVPEVMVA
ncbi:hypothetical protein QWZ10_26095 [Paracoccus cavernae]|uniref:Bartonella effector protein BID domain-containing protein n=1 Tax=Paracoccus cavernae TaxID=1571207 RepID=A0ABT8DHP3_9RHOB|nr:hypothetical protein [Paracoccus cavernae]MDN3714415.1 hypothetical protein [Paracoccus cavernae]